MAAAAICVVAALAAALTALRAVSGSPEGVTRAIEEQVQDTLDMPVTIAKARFEWKAGPRVILSGVSIDEPGVVTLRIRSVTAYLSTLRLLLGQARLVKLRLVTPEGSIDVDNLGKILSRRDRRPRPVVIVWKGSVRLVFKGVDVRVEDLSGRITKDWLNLRARAMGGRILLEADLERPGRATFDAYGVRLSDVDYRLGGTAYMNLALSDTAKGSGQGSFALKVKDLQAPCLRRRVSSFQVTSSLSLDGKLLRAPDISVKTPFMKVSARASVDLESGGKIWEDTVLDVVAASSRFSYDEVVSYLPLDRFPGWLAALLGRRIRGGFSRFEAARYHGPVRDLFSGVGLLDRVRVVQTLDGQSFSSGRTPDSITGITGRVVYAGGDIRFVDLTGKMGDSLIKRVDVVFPGALRPKMRVAVSTDLDMPARDFMRAWHAAVMDDGVHGLLDGVSSVTSGRISCRLAMTYNEELRDPFGVKGAAAVEGCSFKWGAHDVTGASGTMKALRFDGPQVTRARFTVDGARVRSLALTTWFPFGRSLSRYVAEIDRLPGIGGVRLENALLRASGTGRGLEARGDMDVKAEAILVTGSGGTYRIPGFTARGPFSAGLAGGIHLSLPDVDARVSSDTLVASAEFHDASSRVALSGSLDLAGVTFVRGRMEKPLSGRLRGMLRYDAGTDGPGLRADIELADAVVPLTGAEAVVDGQVRVEPGRIVLRKTRVRAKGARVVLDGTLVKDETHRDFRGSVEISGLAVAGDGHPGEDWGVLDGLTAKADVRLRDCVFRGFTIDDASLKARVAGGVAVLKEIDGRAYAGTLAGASTLGQAGDGSFNAAVSLKGADLGRLLVDVVGAASADGTVDLDARLEGGARTLKGAVSIDARSGGIHKYALVSRIFALLNVYRLVKGQDIDLMSGRFTFNRLRATFQVKDPSTIVFDDFSLESDSLQVSAVGRYDPATREIDAVACVQPLESLDRTVSMIPVVGWVFTGDEGRFIVVSMNVRGNIDDPRVTPAPVETLSNTVVASLLRSLRLPGRIVERSLKALEETP